jgi:hypothetical protein
MEGQSLIQMTLLHQILHMRWIYLILGCVEILFLHIFMIGNVVIYSAVP